MELSTRSTHYNKITHSMKQPEIVGFFSTDEIGNYQLNTDKLSYLRWNRVSSQDIHFDLSVGEDTAVKGTEENFNGFYRYMCDHPKLVHNFSATSLKDVGFICNRQILRKIADLPYQDKDDEIFAAYLYQGNIFLYYIQEEQVCDPKFERFSHWGYKFEQYMMSKNLDLAPVTDEPVKEGEKFDCVLKMILNNHRLLYVAEMDGIIIDKNCKQAPVPNIGECTEEQIINDLRKRKFLELKTSLQKDNTFKFKKYKTRNIYLQSYFSGVETIVVGFRDYYGIVYDIKKYTAWEMSELGEEFWDPSICINFVAEFLTFVKKCFSEEISRMPDFKYDDDIKRLEPIELFFERKSQSDVVLCTRICDKSRRYLLPWFLDGIAQKSSKRF